MMRAAPLRYIPGQFGNFTAERYGLIGHDEADVAAWLAAHPNYKGGIYFDYADGGEDAGGIDVSERFQPEEADADASAWVESIRELVRGAA